MNYRVESNNYDCYDELYRKESIGEHLRKIYEESNHLWCSNTARYGKSEAMDINLNEKKEEKEGEKQMLIEKTEKMSWEEFLEKKDEKFKKAKIILNEEKVKKFNENYGRDLSYTWNIDYETVVTLYPKAVNVGYKTIPFSFIEEVEVTIRY